MTPHSPNYLLWLLPFGLLLASCSSDNNERYNQWLQYGANPENNHYVSLGEIRPENVHELEVAWSYELGDAERGTQIQVNPIVVDGLLYGVSPQLKLFAVDAATGEEQWQFHPFDRVAAGDKGEGYFSLNVSRGVTYSDDGGDGRIFYAAGGFLFCVNAKTGALIQDFAGQGMLDLHSDLGETAQSLYVAMTSPGVVFEDQIIIGTRVAESAAAAPGHIRSYDIRTGELRWIFHTIPQPGETGYESWEDPKAWRFMGGANAWSGFSLDKERGIVYAALGSASPDFYGGHRKGDNLFANSILALDANTGRYKWHYQTVHHDLWDRDLPSPPVLFEYQGAEGSIPALAQISKQGFVFLLNRVTGEPLFPIAEQEVPSASGLEGEEPARSQPWPDFPVAFARQEFRTEDINDLVPQSAQDSVREVLERIHSDHLFEPPSREGTLIFPGFDGGGEWGGAALHPETQTLFVNASEMPWILTMVPSEGEGGLEPGEETLGEAGERIYASLCISCHGVNREGAGNYPSLTGIESTYRLDDFVRLLENGQRMMPAYNFLSQAEKEALGAFLLDLWNRDEPFMESGKGLNPYWKEPYVSTGYKKFLTPEGYPAIKPPWGTLNAIDLRTGTIKWKSPLGSYPEFADRGVVTGAENYGGPAITRNGLLFIAGTRDRKFRAYRQETGELLWETELPYAGFATPSIYEADGRQFVVIACGGGKLGAESGDAYVAFALPD